MFYFPSVGRENIFIFTGNVPGKAASNVETWVFGGSPMSDVEDSAQVEEVHK